MKFIGFILVVFLIFSCDHQATDYEKCLQDIKTLYDVNKTDSLSQILIGCQLKEYSWIDLEEKVIRLGENGKPIYLQATASWCKPCKAMIPVVNDLAAKYGDRIDFLLITFDRDEKAIKYKEQLHKNIRLIPSTTETNPNGINKIIATDFIHIFPFPTIYYLDQNRIIKDIQIGGPIPLDTSQSEKDMVYYYHEKNITKVFKSLIQ